MNISHNKLLLTPDQIRMKEKDSEKRKKKKRVVTWARMNFFAYELNFKFVKERICYFYHKKIHNLALSSINVMLFVRYKMGANPKRSLTIVSRRGVKEIIGLAE